MKMNLISWKKVECYFSGGLVQTTIFFIINLIYFSKISIISIFSDFFKKPSHITITEETAVLTLFALALGFLYFAGINLSLKKYRLMTSDLNFINKISIMGAGFIAAILFVNVISDFIKQITQNYLLGVFISLSLTIIISIFIQIEYIKHKYRVTTSSIIIIYFIIYSIISLILIAIINLISKQQILLYYVGTISLTVLFFGYIEKNCSKLRTLTLKAIVYDGSGCKRLETKENLELFDRTNTDYRLKDVTTGNEFIIPIGQVQEIIYENETYRSEDMGKLKKEEEEVLYHIYKEKYATNYRPFKISDIISKYIDKYNREEIIDVIGSLVSQGFIVFKIKKIPYSDPGTILKTLKETPGFLEINEVQNDLELCAPVVDKITEIKKLFIYRIGIDKYSA